VIADILQTAPGRSDIVVSGLCVFVANDVDTVRRGPRWRTGACAMILENEKLKRSSAH